MTSSSFTLLIADLGLHKLSLNLVGVADLLVGMGILECAGPETFGVLLVGNSVVGVAYIIC